MKRKEEENYLKDLGERLLHLRRSKGITQEQLAVSIGTKHSQIGRLERGETNSTILILRKIANELGEPLSSIIQ